MKFVSPSYTAVNELAPEGSAEVARTATPVESRVPAPSDVVPLKNSTEPVGIAVLGLTGVTVAVNVTDSPDVDGFGDEASAVLEDA